MRPDRQVMFHASSMTGLRNPMVLLVACAVLLAAGAARADVCVEVDTAHDTLSPQDRASARILLEQTLTKDGAGKVSDTNCTETWTMADVKLGNTIDATLTGPKGNRTATATSLDELPALYDQMVRSLLTGTPMSSAAGAELTRDNVTVKQAAPLRVAADSLWYANLGYSAIAGAGYQGGPGFGLGWRYELDSWGIDASLGLAYSPPTNTDSSNGAVSGSWLRLQGLYFLNPTANASPYVGGGISWGGVAVSNSSHSYSKTGLQGEVTLGYELLRASTIRLFVQLGATLPFYAATADNFDDATGKTTTSSTYAPTFLLSLGMAFGGQGRTVNVHLL